MAWLRLYEEVLDDPKVMLLRPDVFRSWVLFLCASKARDGILPKQRQLAYRVRLDDEVCAEHLRELIEVGLIDETEEGLMMHAWDKRQYISDLSTSRVNKYRETRAKAGLTPTGYQKHRSVVLERDGGACRYCGSTEKLVLDHLLPVARGGDDSIENLITACKSCNAKKRDRLPEECGMFLRPIAASRFMSLDSTRTVTPVTNTVTPVTPVTDRGDTESESESDVDAERATARRAAPLKRPQQQQPEFFPFGDEPDVQRLVSEAVEEIAQFWPMLGNVPNAKRVWERHAVQDAQGAEAWCSKIRQTALVHSVAHEQCRKANGKHFVPTLERWVQDGDYSRKPPVALEPHISRRPETRFALPPKEAM